MEYDIKRGWFKNIEGDLLEQMMAQVFGNVKKEGDLLVSTYGVLDRIEVKILAKDKLDIATVNKEGAAASEGPEEGEGRHPLRAVRRNRGKPFPSFLIIRARGVRFIYDTPIQPP